MDWLAAIAILTGLAFIVWSLRAFFVLYAVSRYMRTSSWQRLKQELAPRYRDYVRGRNGEAASSHGIQSETVLHYGMAATRDGNIETRSNISTHKLDEIS